MINGAVTALRFFFSVTVNRAEVSEALTFVAAAQDPNRAESRGGGGFWTRPLGRSTGPRSVPRTERALRESDYRPAIASDGYDGTVRVWDLASGTYTAKPLRHERLPISIVTLSPHSRHL
jgi:WD40 repeat protein